MDKNNKITINRRQFNRGALTASLIVAAPFSALSNSFSSKPDGLIQLKRDGRVYLYSGGGHLGLYGDYSNVENIAKTVGCLNDELVIVCGDNAGWLPCVLGQNMHSLSYSALDTSLRAAKLMKQIRKGYKDIPRKAKIVVEDGISQTTKDLIKTLDPQGIIIAVRG